MFEIPVSSRGVKIGRRSLLASATLAWLPAWAAWPDHPIRVVVPWPAGGVVDIPARLISNQLQGTLGQSFIIENKLGAGGSIGADAVAKAAPDGNTLCVTTSAMCINQALGIKAPFDAIKDFAPVALLGTAPAFLVVAAGRGINTVDDLVKLARSKPGQVTYASAGNGSPAHLAGEWMKSGFQIDIVHVPYKGAPAAMIDLIGGRVDMLWANAAVALPQLKAGKVVALAVGSPAPLPTFPNVPTMQSSGLAGFNSDQWIGLLGPAGTPRDVVAQLAAGVKKALEVDSVRADMDKSGIVAAAPSGTPESFQKLVLADLENWTKVVKTANIKVS